MNKDIFLRDLNHLLSDLPQEEREQALEYYEDYFEDAGSENEQQVIQELGSPIEIAKQIKASNQENIAYGQGNDFHRTSSYPDLYVQKQSQDNQNARNQNYQNTDSQYDKGQSKQNTDSHYDRNQNYQNAGPQYNRNQNYQNTGPQYDRNQNYQNTGPQYDRNQNYQNTGSQYNSTENGYFQGDHQFRKEEPKKNWSQDPGKIALIIVLAILAIPIGIPLVSTIFALVVSIFAVCFALIIAVFALGGGLAIGGVGAVIASFTLFPLHGIASSILVAGIGLVLFAAGVLIFSFAIWFCIKFFPAAAKTLVNCGRSIGRSLKSFFQ